MLTFVGAMVCVVLPWSWLVFVCARCEFALAFLMAAQKRPDDTLALQTKVKVFEDFENGHFTKTITF